MFKGRSFLVKVVKDQKGGANGPLVDTKAPAPDYDVLVRALVAGTVVVIAVYMGADTLRKILVHVVATKIR